MRKSPNGKIEKYRLTKDNCVYPKSPMLSETTDGNNGLFIFNHGHEVFRCIASDKKNWDHVSVSVVSIENDKSRLPTWQEMCWIKELFWEPEEEVFQLHPKKSNYINVHPHVLHLWRPQKESIPTPPKIMV